MAQIDVNRNVRTTWWTYFG